jgi:hypothetical protein
MNVVQIGLQARSGFSIHLCLSVCHTAHCANTDYFMLSKVSQLLKKFSKDCHLHSRWHKNMKSHLANLYEEATLCCFRRFEAPWFKKGKWLFPDTFTHRPLDGGSVTSETSVNFYRRIRHALFLESLHTIIFHPHLGPPIFSCLEVLKPGLSLRIIPASEHYWRNTTILEEEYKLSSLLLCSFVWYFAMLSC